jgi:hypothetical protein
VTDNEDLKELNLRALTRVAALVVERNASLTSLAGLSSLVALEAASIVDNPLVSHCDAILLRNQTGLPGMTLPPFTVSGNDVTGVTDIVYITAGHAATTAGAHELPDIRCIARELLVFNTAAPDAGPAALFDLSFPNLVAVGGIYGGAGGGRLQITNNPGLRSLSAPLLRSHGGHVVIGANPNLTTLDLSSLERVAWYVQVLDNDALTDLDGLAALRFVDASLAIRENGALPSSEACMIGAQVAANSPGTAIAITNNADTSVCE